MKEEARITNNCTVYSKGKKEVPMCWQKHSNIRKEEVVEKRTQMLFNEDSDTEGTWHSFPRVTRSQTKKPHNLSGAIENNFVSMIRLCLRKRHYANDIQSLKWKHKHALSSIVFCIMSAIHCSQLVILAHSCNKVSMFQHLLEGCKYFNTKCLCILKEKM